MHSKICRRLSVLILCLMTACSSSYNRIETGGTERTGMRLDDGLSVLVTTPKDGGYDDKIYKRSGTIVAHRIDAAFSTSARLVDIYPSEYHSLSDLKDVLAKNDYGYIVVPTINIWARTEKGFSKVPNQMSVKIVVLDATTGEELSSNVLEEKGVLPPSLFGSNEEPEAMLLDAANDYVDDLYGVTFVGRWF